MEFRIPFSFAPIGRLRKHSAFFVKFVKPKEKSTLRDYLRRADAEISREEYLSICLHGAVFSFFIFLALLTGILFLFEVKYWFFLAPAVSFPFAFFIFFNRVSYPKVYCTRKQREIEKNIIPALQDMLVQLTAGVPLFSILVNLSIGDYGALSYEFKKIVRKINAGIPETQVFDETANQNPSLFFRRALWQISNGMKAGSDISDVTKESIKSLNEEQFIQIQNYGNKLNPSIMFYMLFSVILPALAITFLVIISSLVNLSRAITVVMFVVLFVLVVFAQIMFLGIIKSMRPSLL